MAALKKDSFTCIFSNTDAVSFSWESRHPCLVFDIREETFSNHDATCRIICRCPLSMVRKFPSILVCWGIFFFMIMNGGWILSNDFFVYKEIMIIWLFFFSFWVLEGNPIQNSVLLSHLWFSVLTTLASLISKDSQFHLLNYRLF